LPVKRIVLIGFMGTGKTAIGKRLAKILGFRFLDIDSIIETREKKSISQIFQDRGEPFFRDLEKKIIEEISPSQGVVIATGGGAILNPANRNKLKQGSWVVCLTATPEKIHERTSRRTLRPLLKGKEPLETIKNLLRERSQAYSEATLIVDTTQGTVSEITEKIFTEYRKLPLS